MHISIGRLLKLNVALCIWRLDPLNCQTEQLLRCAVNASTTFTFHLTNNPFNPSKRYLLALFGDGRIAVAVFFQSKFIQAIKAATTKEMH